jgi:IclR family pca regulon transcriptional regulator
VSDEASRYFVKSLERALAVMRSFDEGFPTMTLSEAACRAGVTRASARRILLSLVDLGYAAQQGGRFSLRPKVLDLGRSYLASQGLSATAQPLIERLSAEIQESVSLAVLDGDEIVYIARSAVSRLVTISIGIGSRLPAFSTALGRTLAADLPADVLESLLASAPIRQYNARTVTDPLELRKILARVRAQGFALVDDELEVGLRSLAVPVRNSSGAVIAALGTSSYAGRVSRKTLLDEVLPKLKALEDVLSSSHNPAPASRAAGPKTARMQPGFLSQRR